MAERSHTLITGAGMLGAYTARRLLDAGHRVTLLDRQVPHEYLSAVLGDREFDTVEVDLTDLAATERVLAEVAAAGVDGVVHTAALIAARAQRDALETLEVNVAVPMRLAEWAAGVGARRFVTVSSWSVFDEGQPGPITEQSRLVTQFKAYYIASKLAMEHMLSAQANASGLEIVALRPAVIYGYGPNLGGSVGSATIEKQVLRALDGAEVVLPSNIISQTELVYVDDVAAMAVAALGVELEQPFASFTAGSQETTTLEELADTFRELFPGVPVSIAPGSDSSVIPPKQDQPTDLADTLRTLALETPLRRREGFERFVAELREAGARGVAR
ncbi:MAG: NAD-dependent epimerase/dehydratase family protein [Leucobacter sp.]